MKTTETIEVGDIVQGYYENGTAWNGPHYEVSKINQEGKFLFKGFENAGYYNPRQYPFKIITKSKPKVQLSGIVSGDGTLTVVLNGKPYSIPKNSLYYNGAKESLKNRDVEALKQSIDLEYGLTKKSGGKVTYENGVISCNGQPVHNALTERIYKLIQEDFPFEPMLKFLENVLLNPDEESVKDLYTFLEKNNLPITEDGHFLAWKYVTHDFKDCYTKKFDNSPGKVVSMSREKVNKDRYVTCSSGLHCCSYTYLPQTSNDSESDKIVLVKVNPKNVCAVPTDYNNAKMRVCEYEVLEHVTDVLAKEEEFKTTPVYKTNKEVYGTKPNGQKFYAGRGANGRFVKKTS